MENESSNENKIGDLTILLLVTDVIQSRWSHSFMSTQTII